jgi:hypothetical protein
VGDRTRGLYGKFRVERTDGSSAPGEKHAGCDYFTLDLTHDPFAAPAIAAYADACAAEYPSLARDLRAKLCAECGGAGVLDSGGFTPGGEAINVPCPACSKPPPASAARGTKSDRRCWKCGAYEVYVETIGDGCDKRVTCHGCGYSYSVDGADS